MSARIIQFPTRNTAAIFVREVPGAGWLVLARGHAWAHGDRHAAVQDAEWLSDNLSLPIRVS
jgi:hypothetical protein